MDGSIVFVIVLILFLLLLFLGMHIGAILIVAGLTGMFLIDGFRTFPAILQDTPFYSIASLSLSTIPLFIIMAQFILRSDAIRVLYKLVYDWSRKKGSVLGGFTLLLGGFLGALSGSATAISAALAEISMPELRKRGFDKYLAGATVATAGSLSTIIPPSVILIVYGVATTTSIGELFIAALIPSIITMFLMFVTLFVLYIMSIRKAERINKIEIAATNLSNGKRDTSDVADVETSPMKKVIYITSLILIIVVIFGGIFSGVLTATEAGGAGAFLSLVMAFILRKTSLDFFKQCIEGTIKITCMVLFIILGASIFGQFMTISLVPGKIIGWVEPLLQYPILLIISLLAIYFFLFMFIEGTAAIIMTVSIAVPVAVEAGYSPVVFGVLLTVVCTSGLLTPPVGLSVYSVSGVSNLSVHRLFGYAMIYALVMVAIMIPLLLAFPQLMTWLPSLM